MDLLLAVFSIEAIHQCLSNVICQPHRHGVSDLLICKCSGRLSSDRFKIVAVWESLNSCCFSGRYGSVLPDVRVNIVMAITTDVCNYCLSTVQISCDNFETVQKTGRIFMRSQMLRKICIGYPGSVFIPCFHYNPVNLQILIRIGSCLVECNRFPITFFHSGKEQVFSRVRFCCNGGNHSFTGMNGRKITKQFTNLVLKNLPGNIGVKVSIFTSFTNQDDPFPVLQNTVIRCVQWSKLCAVSVFLKQFQHIIEMAGTIFVFCRKQSQNIFKHKVLGTIFTEKLRIMSVQVVSLVAHHFCL